MPVARNRRGPGIRARRHADPLPNHAAASRDMLLRRLAGYRDDLAALEAVLDRHLAYQETHLRHCDRYFIPPPALLRVRCAARSRPRRSPASGRVD